MSHTTARFQPTEAGQEELNYTELHSIMDGRQRQASIFRTKHLFVRSIVS